ncbi:MAG: hypothetical protein A2236_03195 [Bacteroidetes bacterium RIFOXYA2_FULL_33_7]|nr:MAG: hypothetical protein A2236_03195 [Bacteroidetes bacterium RIFOXYA2_FULL_33_7]
MVGTDSNSKLILQRNYSLGWGTSLDLRTLSSTTDYIYSERAIGAVAFSGEYNGDANVGVGAQMRAYTTENWSASGYGSRLEFLTVANASTTGVVRMTIGNDGKVGIANTAPGSELDVKGTLRLTGSTSGYVGFAPAAAAGSTTYTLPSADGTTGQVLQTNGSGVLSWLTPSTPSTGWQITGNSGTTDGTHFIGTTDDVALNFRVNNEKAGRIYGSTTFLGYQAGNSNTSTGSMNTGIGNQALYSNTTGDSNTGVGYYSLKDNTTGYSNTGVGEASLTANSTGYYNTAMGFRSLDDNTTGFNNSSFGFGALNTNISGNYNTAVGASSLLTNETGSYNTTLGYYADVSGQYSNATAIGNGATATASNEIMIGNTSVTEIGGEVGWTTYSDGRFKFNVTENVKGLEFINKLRPVTYQLNTKELDDFVSQNMPDENKASRREGMDFTPSTAIIHSGFIAQEVESAAKECGFESSIVQTPDNDADPYALTYAEIVVPLVKAVQEQQKIINDLSTTVNELQEQLNALNGNGEKTMQNNIGAQGNSINIHDLELAENAFLYQNVPNPFSEGTTIKYFIPENANAQIIFYNEFGSQIKIFNIEENGMGQLNISASNLAAGMYSYSLIISEKVIDTKKMIKQ